MEIPLVLGASLPDLGTHQVSAQPIVGRTLASQSNDVVFEYWPDSSGVGDQIILWSILFLLKASGFAENISMSLHCRQAIQIMRDHALRSLHCRQAIQIMRDHAFRSLYCRQAIQIIRENALRSLYRRRAIMNTATDRPAIRLFCIYFFWSWWWQTCLASNWNKINLSSTCLEILTEALMSDGQIHQK